MDQVIIEGKKIVSPTPFQPKGSICELCFPHSNTLAANLLKSLNKNKVITFIKFYIMQFIIRSFIWFIVDSI